RTSPCLPDSSDVTEIGSVFGVHLFGEEAQAVAARDAGRDDSDFCKLGHQIFSDLPCEDHLRDVAGGLVGDAQSIVEPRFDAQPVEQSSDLFAAAVNQDQFESRAFKLSDLSDQLLAERGLKKDAAAEF